MKDYAFQPFTHAQAVRRPAWFAPLGALLFLAALALAYSMAGAL